MLSSLKSVQILAIGLVALLQMQSSHADSALMPDILAASLKERYRQGMISLTSSTLSSFRAHLADKDRRSALDKETDPIPQACRLLAKYLDQVFPSFLQPTRGVVLLQINLLTNRAYVKLESDFSGSLAELEWTAAEVRSVAILIDVLLRGADLARQATSTAKINGEGLSASWKQFSSLSNSPYVPTTALAGYLRGVVYLAKGDRQPIVEVKEADPRAYSEIMTFFANTSEIERATATTLGAQGVTNKKGLLIGFDSPVADFKYEATVSKILLDQALAAKNLKKISGTEASELSASRIAPAYSSSLKSSTYNWANNFDMGMRLHQEWFPKKEWDSFIN